MNLSIDRDKVRVELHGFERIKIETKLRAILGPSLVADKHALCFPASSLPLVSGLICDSNRTEEVTQAINRVQIHEGARRRALDILTLQDGFSIPEFWCNRLDPGQVSAVAAMTLPGLSGLCQFDEQGSGKTVMTIASYDILKEHGLIDGMIVVCPKTMISEWANDIERFLPGKYEIVVPEGSKGEKFDTALSDHDILLCNYEGIEPILTPLIAKSDSKRFLLVADESFFVKNRDAKRSTHLGRLRASCERCFVLCGTPAPNSAYDLINQFDLADAGYTFTGFRRSNNEDKDREIIMDRISTRGTFIRRLKTQILQTVPQKSFNVIKVTLDGRQKFLYERARNDLELYLKGLDNKSFKRNLATYFQRRSALLQICTTPSSVDPTVTDDPVKYQKLDQLVTELTSQGRKVIIWSFYRRSLDEIEERYAELNPVRIDGSVGATDRKNAVRLFQDDPSRMVFIGNPAAAGAGLTLHASYDAIYLSYSNQAAHYLQSLDRIHRRGQQSNVVNYHLLICENTIEEGEVLRLRAKELQQHSVMGDHTEWPTSLDDALAELSAKR